LALHLIARSGDAETMRILQELDLSGIDIDRADGSGETPTRIMRERTDSTDELENAFSTLLHASRSSIEHLHDSEGEQIVWQDAVESQQNDLDYW
jgi:hypothetical protein